MGGSECKPLLLRRAVENRKLEKGKFKMARRTGFRVVS